MKVLSNKKVWLGFRHCVYSWGYDKQTRCWKQKNNTSLAQNDQYEDLTTICNSFIAQFCNVKIRQHCKALNDVVTWNTPGFKML